MAKTYNSIPTVSTGDVYTATAHNNIATNVNNYRVPPMCAAERTSQSINNVTDTLVQFTSGAQFDTDGMFSSGANTRITIQTAGVYLIVATLRFQNDPDGARYCTIKRNGATVASAAVPAMPLGYDADLTSARIMSCSASDYFELNVFHAAGNTLTLTYGALGVTWQGQVS